MTNIFKSLKFKILDRYIISEFWMPFFAGAGIITGVWLSADELRKVFKLVTISDTPIGIALTILGLQLPEILVTTIPIGVLWAAFLVFTRLNNDSEIIAFRTSGVSLLRILKPVVLFGLLTTAASFAINEVVVPLSSPLARKLEIYSVYKAPFSIAQKNFTYLEKSSDKKLKRIFYAAKYDPDKDLLKNIIILDFTKQGLKQIHTAKHAKWTPKRGGWELYKGISHIIANEDELARISSFDEFFIPSDSTPAKLIREISRPEEMNFLKLNNFIALQRDNTIHTDEYTEALVAFHEKFARPFACLLIALVGAPLAILPRRSVSSWNYAILAIIIFQFYVTQSVCASLAEAGRLVPFIAAWFPNVVLLIIALLIIRQKAKLA